MILTPTEMDQFEHTVWNGFTDAISSFRFFVFHLVSIPFLFKFRVKSRYSLKPGLYQKSIQANADFDCLGILKNLPFPFFDLNMSNWGVFQNVLAASSNTLLYLNFNWSAGCIGSSEYSVIIAVCFNSGAGVWEQETYHLSVIWHGWIDRTHIAKDCSRVISMKMEFSQKLLGALCHDGNGERWRKPISPGSPGTFHNTSDRLKISFVWIKRYRHLDWRADILFPINKQTVEAVHL